MKRLLHIPIIALAGSLIFYSCQKGDLTNNPNVGNIASPTLLLNAISVRLANGGGVTDGGINISGVTGNAQPGAIAETFWNSPYKYGQYHLSNYSYYQGTNSYNWSYSATQYDMLKYIVALDGRLAILYPTNPTTNAYSALTKFYRAYSFIWLAQRVGDIPMDESGSKNILKPKFNTQKEVFAKSLVLLDSANIVLANLMAKDATLSSTTIDAAGDIFGLTYLGWRKIINAYRLRVLIALSKRADDNTDLNVKQQFAAMLSDAVKYPLPTSNSEGLIFKFNSVNQFPLYNSPYNQYANISKTILDLTTKYKDPRTFAIASPAPDQLKAGVSATDFAAYVGADPNLGLSDLASNASKYSSVNYQRYNTSQTGSNCEAYVLMGYAELCFNIAEGINRGWANGDASAWYNKGVDASLATFKLTNGTSFPISNYTNATTLGTATIDIATFKSNIAYKSGTAGLTQILEQKYVAMFENSAWEAFYNWRRTGVPSFAQGGAGIGTAGNKIPRRWLYSSNEATENATNYQAALQSQFGGKDDVMADTWLTK